MKFKNYIETESGIKDTSTSPGTAGQVLSSTVTGTSWIDPDTLVSAASKLVVIACKNVSGVPILKGTPVYQSGTVGATDVIEVEPADATISTGYLPAIGILQTTLNNNGLGNVVITGEFLNYSTSGIPSNNPGGVPITGDTVYLAVGGGLTCIKPTGAGNAIQNLGLIGKVSGGNAGSITVASIMRANDVPNLPTGRIWIGDGNTIVSDTVYVDEPNGRVGIGTTSPSQKLHVDGNARLTGLFYDGTNSGGTNGQILSSDGGQTEWIDGSAIPGVPAGSGTINYLARWTPDANTLGIGVTYDNGTNVGIGTTSPNSKLQVDGEIDANGGDGYRINGKPWAAESSNNLRLGDWDGEGFTTTIYDDYSAPVVLVGEGKVGIGTTSPGAKLEVVGESGVIIDSGTYNKAKLTLIGDASTYGGGGTIDVIGGSSDYIIYDLNVKRSPNTMEASNQYNMGNARWSWDGNIAALRGQPYTSYDFKSQGSSQMVIYNNNVGIGTTSPSRKLHVVGRVASTAGNGFEIINSYGSPRLSDFYGTFTTSSSLYVGSPYSGQACYASAFNITSDYRLKENKASLTEASSRIKKLKPIRFNYISSENTIDGFLAHEVAEVIPEAVTGKKDAVREDGSDELQGLDLSKIVPLLTAALQESITKIEQLEQRIQTLENK